MPFAFAIGSLLARRADERWIVATRRWTLAAWTFLGIGQLLGAHWAYVEVGWGGYFAWDPVENAALMPWLAATAFLHSVMVQEKKGMLKVWNMLLVILAFCLALFGTFLTRSGSSTPSTTSRRARSARGSSASSPLVAALSIALVLSRLPLLRSQTRLESPVSREASFLYNNLLLVALCLTVLWGVVYPILSEAVTGEERVVGPPYYNFFLRAFGLPLLLLMGIGPLLAWRRASIKGLRRSFLWPAAVALVDRRRPARHRRRVLGARARRVHVLGVRAGGDRRGVRPRDVGPPLVDGGALAGRALLARIAATGDGTAATSCTRRSSCSPSGSRARAPTTRRARLASARASSWRPARTRSATTGWTERRAQNAIEGRAQIDVSRDGRSLGRLEPGRNFYPAEQQTSSEMAIRSDWLRAEDLDLVVRDFDERNESIQLKVLVKPLVNLIWAAGFIFLAGSLIAMWPDAREQRRLALRYREAGAEAVGRA